MNKVVKYDNNQQVSVEKTLFRSALLKDCVRYMYSRTDFKELVVLNSVNEVVDTKDYVNGHRY